MAEWRWSDVLQIPAFLVGVYAQTLSRILRAFFVYLHNAEGAACLFGLLGHWV